MLAVPDLVTVFPRRQLAEILMKMVTSLPLGQLTETKLTTLQSIVQCELFRQPDCRQVGSAKVTGCAALGADQVLCGAEGGELCCDC